MTTAKVDFSSVRLGLGGVDEPRTLYSTCVRKPLGIRFWATMRPRGRRPDRLRLQTNSSDSLPASNQYLVALRAKQLDDWCADYLRQHPDAVVLHLGCGLDSRAFRLDLPPSVRWFDLDQPVSSSFAAGCTTTPGATR